MRCESLIQTATASAACFLLNPVSLTDMGRRRLKSCRRRADAIEERMLRGLSKTEERTIRNWLSGLAASMAAER